MVEVPTKPLDYGCKMFVPKTREGKRGQEKGVKYLLFLLNQSPGNSLSPVINSGDTVKILFGYYDCHQVERGDIVAHHYVGNENPIIKIVKGLPRDSYELKEAGLGEWHILINGQILENSEDKPYLVSGNRYKMLSLYEDDYKNGIPQNTYLILGNLVEGSLDATRFGFVDKSDILGKVVH